MKGLYTILLLIVSNVFMTFAWYGQLKLPEVAPGSKDWPLIFIILLSWGIALIEYCFMIPANRIGSVINGGPFNLIQLKVIQEAISLIVFTAIDRFQNRDLPMEPHRFLSIDNRSGIFCFQKVDFCCYFGKNA